MKTLVFTLLALLGVAPIRTKNMTWLEIRRTPIGLPRCETASSSSKRRPSRF